MRSLLLSLLSLRQKCRHARVVDQLMAPVCRVVRPNLLFFRSLSFTNIFREYFHPHPLLSLTLEFGDVMKGVTDSQAKGAQDDTVSSQRRVQMRQGSRSQA